MDETEDDLKGTYVPGLGRFHGIKATNEYVERAMGREQTKQGDEMENGKFNGGLHYGRQPLNQGEIGRLIENSMQANQAMPNSGYCQQVPKEPGTSTKLNAACQFLEEAFEVAEYIEHRVFHEVPAQPGTGKETMPAFPASIDGQAAFLSEKLASLVGYLKTIESRL